MIHFALSVFAWWFIYKVILRITEDQFPGIVAGVLFFVVSGFSFIAGGWWSLIGYAIFIYAVAAYFQPLIEFKSGAERKRESSVRPLPFQKTEYLADIEFDYRDASDNASHRRVGVETVDDEYFEGFCHKACDTRTFVIGRVRGKILDRDSGELLPPRQWAAVVRNDARNSGVVMNRGWKPAEDEADEEIGDQPIEILFTGFSKERRRELEDQAQIFDMVVRKNVTQGLTHLCAGPNAGPTKLEQAAAAGVQIIDVDGFIALLKN
jgi:hypothetical protein